MIKKFRINKKLFKQLDFGIIIICIIIMLFGSLNILSATQYLYRGNNIVTTTINFHFLKMHLLWLMIGLSVMYLILLIDYKVIQSYASIIYWFGIFLLILNAIMPVKVNGAESWLKIGPLPQFQPSEFVKIALIIMIAKQLDEMDGNINNIKNFLKLCVYAIIPVVFLLKQPDMGMTMFFFFILLGMFFIAGLNSKTIVGGLIGVSATIALVWNSGLIRIYQKNRLISFLYPDLDPLGTGLQLTMSQIGIGKGGILGTGFLKGSWAAVGSTPESSTDCIFSVVGEEWGLVGAIFLLTLYGLLIYKLVKIAKDSKDIFGTMLTAGIISMFLFSILQNIGMNIGIMPITGLTLPFMSYGGSSIITTFICIGLVLNVGMRRKKFNF
ncbi:rod shape-determining protein RodA [Clostridium estertheticum]|uniref:rod shape-determining protein RodA n=1 Tax=Clostridium estertheticum TaxID=238834 RepID=UPI0013E8FBFC|nr:rod shape-determining protein RodA [Clostridium estertheticum]MBZ9686966.1 rod shape-determining protein RodA [Clostridium estertheticum]